MGIAHPVYKLLYRIHNGGPNISPGTINCIMQVFKHRWHHPSMFPDKLISRITHDRYILVNYISQGVIVGADPPTYMGLMEGYERGALPVILSATII